ncbi:hypothetical protein OQG81_03570 [Streptococcus macedonicus]|uniref:Uncharacterized protein n=1 Tax=Streptococcus macedonicus TaxID=59310 RepID=A0AA47IK89_STRMC|nr:hypothetical protein [Streptococcus macedonicus]WAK63938.1 hypothetical protein OQG81_03570 [Streptococcus macedonicus]
MNIPIFIVNRELSVRFPVWYFNDDPLRGQKKISEKLMKCMTSFHVLFKNKGRGEAVDVSLDSVKIEK